MKRTVLFSILLALGGLILTSSAAGALDYQVYRLPTAAAKLASISQTLPDVPVSDYVVTDPAHDSTITVLHPGQRTVIAAGERVYLADADTFFLTKIGEGALVFLAPGAIIHDSPTAPLLIGGKGKLTQIVGPGQTYKTKGLIISNEVEIQNTLLAGHYNGIWIVYQNHNINIKANALYVTNNRRGILAWDQITNNDAVHLNIENASFWKNGQLDLYFEDAAVSMLAKNCDFLSHGDDVNYTDRSVSIYSSGTEDSLKYTIEFIDCIFSRGAWIWLDTDSVGKKMGGGVVRILNTRPGRNELVQVWPVETPLRPADFNADGNINPTDFGYLSTDFGLNVAQSQFARYYDLNLSGQVDLQDVTLWAKAYLGLDRNTSIDSLADQLANTTPGKNLLKSIALGQSSPVVEAIMADPVLRPALEPFLQMTAVEEEATTPDAWSLSQNYPNPFNPVTTISFSLPERTTVDISIYNLAGQNIRTLAASNMEADVYQLSWDGTDSAGKNVGSGIYFCILRAGSVTLHSKMTLLR